MYLAHIFSGHGGPSSLGNLAHLDGMKLSAGPGRPAGGGPIRPAAHGSAAPRSFSAADRVRLERHQKRVREQEEHDRRQRAEERFRDR